ncbi:hypothetical protein Ocin01_01160 [Orchesella cincta]|uniref:WH2 domain-containing protein n=1 Tax=Orchesella cincta TaxID=48709 RepID=A0A1D2NJX3_ORCCI|nr:hypothetical protein Ocin01_01160 [Orchesella cincta]
MTSSSNGTLSRRNSCGQQEKPPPPRRNSSISSSARSSPVPTNSSSNIYSSGQGCTMTQSQSSMNNSEYQTIQRNSNSSHPLQPIFIKNPQYSYVSSNNSVVSSQGSFDSGETTPHASMESLPPPPAYLINEQNATTILTATAEDLSKRLSVADTVRTLTEKNHQPLSPNMVRRANSMKQPGEEIRESRSQSQTNGRRGSASTLESSKQRANLMQVLNQKLAQHQTPPPYSSGYPPIPNQKPIQPIYHQTASPHHPPTSAHHPPQPIYSQVYQPQPIYQQVNTGNGSAGNNNAASRHPRRLSEELLKTTATFVQNRVLGSKTPPPIVTSKEIFVQTLNAKLSQMRPSPNEKKVSTMQHPQMQMQSSNGRASGYSSKHAPSKPSREEISRAIRVRKWISSKTVSDPAVCRDSLMDQIRRGTKLRTTRAMNDRSAPRIH